VLLAVRLLLPAACLYGALLEWYSGAGDTVPRRAALILASLAGFAEVVAAAGIYAAVGAACVLVASSLAASLAGTPPFWQVVVLVALVLAGGARLLECCSCRRSRPGSCCACTCACTCLPFCPPQPWKQWLCRVPRMLARWLGCCAAVLLVPALTAQLAALDCLPPATASMGVYVAAVNDYMTRLDTNPALALALWQPSPGALVLRSASDANSTYALWLSSSRMLHFAGTHTGKMLALDLAVTPRALRFGGGSSGGGSIGNASGTGGLGGACGGEILVHGGFYTAYEAVRDAARAAVSSALATSNSTSPITFLGFSLGASMASLAALDMACSGLVPPAQLRLFSMAGPGFCSGEGCAGAFDYLQSAGLAATRLVNVFDIVPWLPALMYEPLRTPPGHSFQSASMRGTNMLRAHQGSGYLPPAADACAGQRAAAWVPFVSAAALGLLCLGVDAWLVCRGGGSGGGGGSSAVGTTDPVGVIKLSLRGGEGEVELGGREACDSPSASSTGGSEPSGLLETPGSPTVPK
jgi:hypothetical protein